MLERIDGELSAESRQGLEELQRRCCQPQILARPGFAEIEQALGYQ